MAFGNFKISARLEVVFFGASQYRQVEKKTFVED